MKPRCLVIVGNSELGVFKCTGDGPSSRERRQTKIYLFTIQISLTTDSLKRVVRYIDFLANYLYRAPRPSLRRTTSCDMMMMMMTALLLRL